MNIELTDYQPLKEGVHNFLIESVKISDTFYRLDFTLKTETGHTVYKTFKLMKEDNTVNTVALNIFSWFARCAFNDENLKGSINPMDLQGRYIQAKASKYTYTNSEGNEKTAFNLGEYKPCPFGYNTALETETPTITANNDLNNIFG